MNKNNKTTTYGELETMIDCWSHEMLEYKKIFENQSDAINKLFFEITNNNEKVFVVGYKVSILNHMHDELDKDLKSAVYLVEKFENVLLHLQSIVVMLQGTDPVDVLRERIYGLAEHIDRRLYMCHEELDLLTEGCKQLQPKTTMEKIVKIMQTLMEHLEFIETKMEQTKQHVNWIHTECQKIISAA